VIYVDNIILATHYLWDSVLIQTELAKHFEMNKAEDLNWFLGIKIMQNRANEKTTSHRKE
jgi:hypothetical protein